MSSNRNGMRGDTADDPSSCADEVTLRRRAWHRMAARLVPGTRLVALPADPRGAGQALARATRAGGGRGEKPGASSVAATAPSRSTPKTSCLKSPGPDAENIPAPDLPALRVFASRDHDGVWLGGVSVVVAADEAAARALLDAALREHGLQPGAAAPYSLREIDLSQPAATVLWDGDY